VKPAASKETLRCPSTRSIARVGQKKSSAPTKKCGDPITPRSRPSATTIADYAIGTRVTRATVPAETGWVFGRNAAAGNPDAPAWLTADELRLICGHCLKDLNV
jgi:hypothetical protein